MKIVTFKTYQEMSSYAADLYQEQLREKPNSVLGLATGSTPIGLYQELCRRNQRGEISFREAVTYNLDEYCGLPPENDQSYRYFMNHNLFDHTDFRKDQLHIPNAFDGDAETVCREYDAAIQAAGGIDLQLLGIGLNGHIGFNEPDDHFTKETHMVELTENTIQANARFFADIQDVPTRAITMGMGAIMSAKKILLVINGEKKRKIFEEATTGKIRPECPATILQLHPDVTVLYSEE